MRAKRITENSVWFINRALEHPRFGTVPDGFNHVVNEGVAAGQTVEHLHWHVIPRYVGDMRDPSGGGRYSIPAMGNYKRPRT
jgi:diadenosine tetraphosphate (Ap4A) HIT family hydrolase